MVKYLGELYNYRVLDSIVIFRTLYLLITFGVHLDGKNNVDEYLFLFQENLLASETSELDPPEHLFRIRLVCTLLDTCGQYFDRGATKKRLDCFLNYFQVCRTLCFSFMTLIFIEILSFQKRIISLESNNLSISIGNRTYL